MDYLTILVQQLNEQMSRVALASSSDLNPVLSIGTAVQRALKYITFDASGNLSLATSLPSGTLSQASILSFLIGAADGLGSVTNIQTAAEAAASVVPTHFAYPADPYIDPRRYGFSLLGSGATNATAFLKAISVALVQVGGGTVIIPPGAYPFTQVAVNFPASWNHLTDSLTIRGYGIATSQLVQSGVQTNVLSFNGFTPTGSPTEAQLTLGDFGVVGTGLGNSAAGILLNGIGVWTIERVETIFFAKGFNLTSALLGTFDNVMAVNCQTGVLARQNGSGSQCNAITVRGGRFTGNSLWAFDIGQSDGWTWTNRCDMEQNGSATAFTFTAGLAGGAVSGTLSSAFAGTSGVYYVSFSDGELRPVTLTNGATTATWTPALSGAVTSAASYPTPTTGVVAIRSTCVTATGVAQMDLQGIWKEANPNPQILVENSPGLSISMKNFVDYDSGVTINVLGCSALTIEDMFSASGLGSTWILNATFGTLKNTECGLLTDTGITVPTYNAVQTSTINHSNGRRDNFTGALTGCTTAPTVNVAIYEQGNEVVLDFNGALTATSNSTGCTITGLQSKYWPASDSVGVMMIQDNGVNSALPCLVTAATGIITLGFGHTFSATGAKGVVGGSLRFRH